MKYLFFDIECANCKMGGRLCEFGYVLTDENFTVIAKDNIMMNPKCEFDRYVISHILRHKRSDYRKRPSFTAFYGKIMSLMTAADTLVIGHSTCGDIKHIADDCERYGLEFFADLRYVDIVEPYKRVSGSSEATGLTKMCKELGIGVSDRVHTADADAEMTMNVVKALCERFGLGLSELVLSDPNYINNFKDFLYLQKIKDARKNYIAECRATGGLSSYAQSKNIRLYIKSVRPERGGRLDGKSLCICELLELCRYRETLNLIRLISAEGGALVSNAAESDIFIDYPVKTISGTSVYCSRRDKAERSIRGGKAIEVITLEAFLASLGTNEAALEKPIKIDFTELRAANARADECASAAPIMDM